MADAQLVPPGVDPTVPSPARLYDYYLGGTNNYEVDRVTAERLRAKMPELTEAAWANRGFHQRAARMIARQGIRQFIDIGSGLPTVGNTHEVVRAAIPNSRVIYIDADPMVELYSRSIIGELATVGVIQADLRDPDAVLANPVLNSMIDFGKPVGLLMTAVLHFVSPASRPYDLVTRYVNALAPGSYLALSHATDEKIPPSIVKAIYEVYENATEQFYFRSHAEIQRFFDGLDFVPAYQDGPLSVVPVGVWGAEDPVAADGDDSRILMAGVARRS